MFAQTQQEGKLSPVSTLCITPVLKMTNACRCMGLLFKDTYLLHNSYPAANQGNSVTDLSGRTI